MARISTSVSMKEYIADNQNKNCSLNDCDKKRAGISKYCSNHQRRKWRYGSPLARRIIPNEMDVERSKVRHVIEYNRNHQTIKSGIDYLQKWLDNAGNEIPGISAIEHFKRLYNEGVTGKELLIEATTVLLFKDNNPAALENQPDTLMMAIGLAILGHRKVTDDDTNYRNHVSELKIQPKERKEVGRIIWQDIILNLIEISKAIQENDKPKGFDRKSEVKLKNAMSQP